MFILLLIYTTVMLTLWWSRESTISGQAIAETKTNHEKGSMVDFIVFYQIALLQFNKRKKYVLPFTEIPMSTNSEFAKNECTIGHRTLVYLLE